VNIKIDVSSIAMQKINRFLTLKVGNLLRADTPELILSERLLWRVPIIYSIPSKGKLGKVGEISVDVETGEILVEQMTPKASAESLLIWDIIFLNRNLSGGNKHERYFNRIA
jgi:hypothetical protein